MTPPNAVPPNTTAPVVLPLRNAFPFTSAGSSASRSGAAWLTLRVVEVVVVGEAFSPLPQPATKPTVASDAITRPTRTEADSSTTPREVEGPAGPGPPATGEFVARPSYFVFSKSGTNRACTSSFGVSNEISADPSAASLS
jgi:hypothetical protein